MEFPLIYCNGDSYSNDRYSPSLLNGTYANVVAESCQGFVINKSINGSCNRRIIRTALHDLILQRQQNPMQKIIALIGLSFELRSEIWVDEIKKPIAPEESNFVTHIFTKQINWRDNLLNGIEIQTPNREQLNEKFFKEYSNGRAFFYSSYAERINLLTDLIMFRATLDSLNINFLVFQSPAAEPLESDYLLDFLKNQIKDDRRFYDLEKFGFCNWANQQGFIPLDLQDTPDIGHFGSDAHRAFAVDVLLPRLEELNFI